MQEYIEPEDIFDINPKPETNTDKANDDMDVDVDILTLDKVLNSFPVDRAL